MWSLKNKLTNIDVANPNPNNTERKKTEKLDNYPRLHAEVVRMWNKETMVIPVIIGALGSIQKDLQKFLN